MTNLLTSFLLLFVLPFVLPFMESNQQWKPVKSDVTFTIKNLGLDVDGHFSDLEADINFSPNHLSSSSITASVKAQTIDTGIDLRDKHLRKDDYFHVDKYPLITLQSNSFKQQKQGHYEGNFTVTIKGTSKKITVPFTFKEQNGKGVFDGSFTIDRRDFDVGGGSLTLSDEATVHIVVQANKSN